MYHEDEEQINERISEIKQTRKDLNIDKKVYFDLIKMQKIAQTEHTVMRRVV